MEAQLIVPTGTDIGAIRDQYPDLSEDDGFDDEYQSYWIGHSMADDESTGCEWMTYEDCVEFCGFCEGAIEQAITCIEGNGPWAQSMLLRTDFSQFATTDEQKQIWKEDSDRYWTARRAAHHPRPVQPKGR